MIFTDDMCFGEINVWPMLHTCEREYCERVYVREKTQVEIFYCIFIMHHSSNEFDYWRYLWEQARNKFYNFFHLSLVISMMFEIVLWIKGSELEISNL